MALRARLVTLPAALAVVVATLLATGPTAAAIGGGDTDPAGAAYVARIDVARTPTSSWTCSGALVAPRLVVTAVHCLYSARPDDWTVTLAHGTPAAEARRVVAAVPYPGAGGPSSPPVEDLAVLVLDRPVAAAPVARDGPAGAATALPSSGGGVVAAGYGAAGPGGAMSPVARRGGQVVDRVVDRAGSPSMLLTRPASTPGTAGAPGVAGAPGIPAGSCRTGDSGGPLVSPGGASTLLGVLSEANDALGVCWFTRLDRDAPTRPWLDRMLAQYGG